MVRYQPSSFSVIDISIETTKEIDRKFVEKTVSKYVMQNQSTKFYVKIVLDCIFHRPT